MDEKKICIIGGGAAGMCMAKWLKASGFAFDLFEKEDDFGGNWSLHSPAGKVYESTQLISSKGNTQFSDFPMPEHYPSYPNHSQMHQYLLAYAKHYDLYSNATFNTEVVSLIPDDTKWQVLLSTGEQRVYDCVLIANGALREPRMPSYPGRFTGSIIHSGAYKTPDAFKGQKVLVVGGGNSGCDIAADLKGFAAKTSLSLRRGYYFMPKFVNGMPTQDWLMHTVKNFSSSDDYWKFVQQTFKLCNCDGADFGLPTPDYAINQAHPTINAHILHLIAHQLVTVKPDIQELKENRVVFKDGSSEAYDSIIYATGYAKSFPFFPPSFWEGSSIERNLYLQIFHKKYANLLFFGYIAAPSGIGNMANVAAAMLVNYLKAWAGQTKSFKTFMNMKQQAEPDLGQNLFYKSERHSYEVDLWKFLIFTNWLKEKLES